MSEAPGRGRQECLSFFLRFQEVLTLSGLRRGRGEPCGHPGSESMDAHDRHATEEQASAVVRCRRPGSPPRRRGSTGATVSPPAAHTAVVEVCGDVTVTGLEARQEGEFFAGLDRPLFPPVVGYAEIAEAAGVSRQRIRQLAGTAGFPVPVIETTQGPLFPKAAAEQWARTRQPKAGRPQRTTAP